MKALNDSFRTPKTVTLLKKNNFHVRDDIPTIIEAGEKHYISHISWGDNSVTSMLQICSFNKDTPIIPIIYGTYFRSTDEIEIFDSEQVADNTLKYKHKNKSDAVKRRSPPLSVQFTPHDEYIILKYFNTTDVIKLDSINHIIDGIVLPFSGKFVIKQGKAQVVSEDDDKVSHFIYQEGYFNDVDGTEIHEEYGEIFTTDSHKKTKYYNFKVAKDKNNNPIVVMKKIPTQQEKLLTYLENSNLTDIDFGFLSK